ncbi:MAG TPA: hypothetical protein EYP35_02925 [Desulfobacterales bacterium]|nr:hypothetical protein [Desulfobacterales bacterium]
MNKNLNSREIVKAGTALGLLIVVLVMFSELSYANEKLQPGNRYKIIRPAYLKAVYNSLNDRQLNKEKAQAYLVATRHYKKSEVAFQYEVPSGTVMTIISPAPNVLWYIPFFAKRYFIKLDPDLSQGLDVILVLNRGVEGNLDGLNPELFNRH